MDIDDALEILGLDPSADRLTAKRAYLRQVKVHKPELDPDGFRRAREAYEVVERRLRSRPEAGACVPSAFSGTSSRPVIGQDVWSRIHT